MAEYIERDTAMLVARHAWGKGLEPSQFIEIIPAADVAPVVRCKDCKHHYDCGVHFCDRLGMDCPDDSDFFCSYGERKDGDSNALD